MKAKTGLVCAMVAIGSLLGTGCAAPGDTAALGMMISVLSHGAVSPRQAEALSTVGQGVQHLSRTQAIAGN